jgi:fatty acid desaturase
MTDQHSPEPGPTPGADRQSQHDQLVVEMEEHTPEGHGAVADKPGTNLPLMLALAVGALIIITVLAWLAAGWLTGLLAMVLVACYLILGWAVAWFSGLLRTREHQDIERDVDRQMHDVDTARRQGPPPGA